jgi:hypothetical protein
MAAPALAALAPINVRPLQRLRCRPFILFKLPTVYQSIPVSILGGHVGEGIALSEVDSGRPWLRRPGRENLRRSLADDGYGCSDADQKKPHSSALGLTLALSEHGNAPVVAEKKNPARLLPRPRRAYRVSRSRLVLDRDLFRADLTAARASQGRAAVPCGRSISASVSRSREL